MAGRRYLNYEETVDLIDKFMKDSGIRTFCEHYCKGACCGTECFNSKNACHKNEGRRLACSFYLCQEVAYLVMPLRIDTLRQKAKYEALEALRKAHGSYLEAYFKPYPQKTIKNYRLYKTEELKKLSFSTTRVRTKINCLLFLARRIANVERRRVKNDIH
jgi:hypothetical protein